MALHCHKMKLLWRFFGSANLPLRQKKAINYGICSLLGSLKQIDQFLVGWFGKLLSVLAQTFHDTSVSQKKTPVKIFASGNLPFRQNKPIKFEIWTLLACSKEISQFWGGWFGKQHSVLTQTFQSPSVSLTFQTKESNKIWNLDPIRLLETNWPIFLWLIWKAGWVLAQTLQSSSVS